MSLAIAEEQAPPADTDFDVVDDVYELLSSVVKNLEPDSLDGTDAAVGVALFSAVEKVAAAGKALCAARVAETRHWRAVGDRTPAHWVARNTGCSMAEALAATQVPERLRSLPATDERFRAGGLTLTQARHISEAATADPGAEARLLHTAQAEPLTVLREQCQQVIAAACEDDEARYRRVHDRRYLRHWTDATGAFRVDLSSTPDVGGELLAALAPIAKRLRRQARRDGCETRKDALLVDALAQLCRGQEEDGVTVRPRVSINITADRAAWLRGRTRPGEKCEIDGTGPIPVSVAQRLVENGVVNEIGIERDDVVSVVSKSRYIPANVRRALIARDPVCPIPGCYERENLEFHHWREDFSKSRRTSVDDLCRPCSFHHDQITRGVMALIGGPGEWQYVPVSWLKRSRAGADPPVLSSA